MTTQTYAARVLDLVEDIGICMLTSKAGQTLRARPMQAIVDRTNGQIAFLTDARAHKDEEIAADPNVCLAFAKPGSNDYVSISGVAEVTADRSAIDANWTDMAKTWFPEGKDDPNIRILTVTPQAAELWDGTSNPLVFAFEVVKARIQGGRPDVGENVKVAMGGAQ